MSAVVDKRVQIDADQAKRLEQMAVARGATEDALISEGLDLLFREQDRQATRAEVVREDRELLAQLEAELGPLQSCGAGPVSLEGATLIVGTPVSAALVRHLEEPC